MRRKDEEFQEDQRMLSGQPGKGLSHGRSSWFGGVAAQEEMSPKTSMALAISKLPEEQEASSPALEKAGLQRE